jgi:hypothetical protein
MGKPKRLRRIFAILLMIAMFALTLPGTVLADDDAVVTIPDGNLKTALLAIPGADDDSSGTLTEGEMKALTGALTLSGLSAPISDITGLQFATGISSLDLSGNTIRDISALGALPLTTLDVTNNYLDIISADSADMAVITALRGKGCTVYCDPQTPIPASGVSVNLAGAVMCPGDTLTLTAAVAPDDAADKAVTWTSGNEEMASVTDAGVVTAIEIGTVDITATTHDNAKAACTVTIKADKIGSAKYLIGGGLLSCVAKRTSVSAFKASLLNGADTKVYKADGTEIDSGTVATGMSVALTVGGTERDRLSIIVNGDTNGDGQISISDYTLTRYDILALKALSGAYKAAGDVNGDGKVSISDYTLIRYDILGLKSINSSTAALPDLPEVSNPNIRAFLDMALAQLGDPYVWGKVGPDTFDCSGFVYYCLKQTGYSLSRSTADTYSRRSSWAYVDRNALQPGDLMFYYSDNPNDGDHIGHIGIYLGNGYHIHASSDYGYVVICRVEGWYDKMLSHGRRVFG